MHIPRNLERERRNMKISKEEIIYYNAEKKKKVLQRIDEYALPIVEIYCERGYSKFALAPIYEIMREFDVPNEYMEQVLDCVIDLINKLKK